MGCRTEDELVDPFNKLLGYESTEEALDRIVPLVPKDVRQIADAGKLFQDPGAWKELRPMLYTLFT